MTILSTEADIAAPQAVQEGLSEQVMKLRRLNDYIDHQSRKSRPLFDTENSGPDAEALALAAASGSASCLVEAIVSAHTAQFDDYDMPTMALKPF